LIFDIYFKIIAATIFGPVSAWIINRQVASSGAFVIGNEQIIAFVLSPTGLITVIISGALALTIIFAEQAGLIFIDSRFTAGQTIKAYQAFWEMIKYLRVLIELGFRQIMIGLLYLGPLAFIAGIAFSLLSSQYDLNFLWVEKPPVFYLGAVMVGFLGIGGLLVITNLYIRWIFSVPLCVLADEKPSVALRKSRWLVNGNFGCIAVIMLVWALLMIAAGPLIFFLLDALSAIILNQVGDNYAIAIAVVCILLAFYGLIASALSFIGLAGNSLLITRMYHWIRDLKGLPRAISPINDPADAHQRPPQPKIIWGVGVLTIIATAISSFLIINDIDLDHRVAITAHRGSSMAAPENTLSAVRQAIADGADFAEIDVQETADGEIVLLHDTDLRRIAGENQKIWQLTYPEIKLLDAGGWFAPKFKGEHIPTLSETLEMSRNKIKLNIELKFNGHEKHLVERVVNIIREKKFESDCVITSLNYDGLRKVEQLNSALKTGFIIAKSIGNMFRSDTDFLSLASGIVNADVIAAARKRNKKVHVWTVNTADNMSYFINLGVDNIITDYPAKLAAVIDQRAALNEIEKLLMAVADMLKR
jgi:glycerophosphoryl diester phosphodiesterase